MPIDNINPQRPPEEATGAAPLVSVVMSVLNGERFLREATDSILAQTFRDFEFIIVNDGSTDGTAAILESYARSDSRVRVYRNEKNMGNAESGNLGCGLAQGRYIARMDADDIALPDRLARQIEFLERNPEVGLLGGQVELIDAAGKTLHKMSCPLEDQALRLHLLRYCPLVQPAVVMRREVFFAAGGYRKFFACALDYDLFLLMAERCQLANLAEVVLKYRFHPQQVSTSQVRQQCLSMLAAQAFAASRRDRKPEPVISAEKITPEELLRLGVNQAAQHRALVTQYFFRMGLMLDSSQADGAARFMNELIVLSRSGPIDRSALSNAMLSIAQIYYRQGRSLRALLYLGRAVLTRPIVAGRPVKRVVTTLLRKSQTQAG